MKKKATAWMLLLCVALSVLTGWGSLKFSYGQGTREANPDKASIRRRIARIMSERLEQGVYRKDGKFVSYTRVPPSIEAVSEIKKYGDDAVPILSAYFKSKSERERSFAVEFMGLLGGRRIIIPPRNVIRRDPSPNVRIQALQWLSEQLPFNSALSVIRGAAKNDSDEGVRKAAKNILETGTVYGAPGFSVPFKKESPRL